MSRVSDLYQLQETDLAIDVATASLTDIEERLSHDEEVVAAREAVAYLEQRLAHLRRQQRDVDLDAEDLRRRVKAAEDKLYGGSVRNPRELEDLQKDIQALTHQLRGREDEVLGLMMQAEETNGELENAKRQLSELEAQWTAQHEELLRQQQAVRSELVTLEQQRVGQLPRVDAPSMSLYSSLRKTRQGRAVARVQQGMCQGCRIALPMTVLQKARPGIELVQCPSCERILFVS